MDASGGWVVSEITTTSAEWRLVEPGLWKLDGTEMFIRLSILGPLIYIVGHKNHGMTAKFSLPDAKARAAEIAAELIEAGIEP